MAEQQAGQFDVVTCMEMLEHVPDPASIISACKKLIKPDGHVFFSTVNRNAKSYAMAIVGAEYIMKLLPKGTHDYKKFILNLDTFEYELIFYKSEKTDRWWVEVPSFKTNKTNHILISCTYDDYKDAGNGDVPERWLKTFQKIN